MSLFTVLISAHLISVALTIGGVIIYIVLGFIALGRRRPRSQQVGFIAFLLGLVVLYIIIKLATTRIPLLG